MQKYVTLDPVERKRFLDDQKNKVVFPFVEKNAFSGHPEIILDAMLCDEQQNTSVATTISATR